MAFRISGNVENKSVQAVIGNKSLSELQSLIKRNNDLVSRIGSFPETQFSNFEEAVAEANRRSKMQPYKEAQTQILEGVTVFARNEVLNRYVKQGVLKKSEVESLLVDPAKVVIPQIEREKPLETVARQTLGLIKEALEWGEKTVAVSKEAIQLLVYLHDNPGKTGPQIKEAIGKDWTKSPNRYVVEVREKTDGGVIKSSGAERGIFTKYSLGSNIDMVDKRQEETSAFEEKNVIFINGCRRGDFTSEEVGILNILAENRGKPVLARELSRLIEKSGVFPSDLIVSLRRKLGGPDTIKSLGRRGPAAAYELGEIDVRFNSEDTVLPFGLTFQELGALAACVQKGMGTIFDKKREAVPAETIQKVVDLAFGEGCNKQLGKQEIKRERKSALKKIQGFLEGGEQIDVTKVDPEIAAFLELVRRKKTDVAALVECIRDKEIHADKEGWVIPESELPSNGNRLIFSS